MISGVCKYCGCTEQRACPTERGPCSWMNQEQTICSGCLRQMDDPELLAATVFEHQMMAEMQIPLVLDTVTLMCVVGLVQLGLRHPDVAPNSPARIAGQGIVDGVLEKCLETGLISLAELIRRGNDPDQRPEEPKSKLIIP